MALLVFGTTQAQAAPFPPPPIPGDPRIQMVPYDANQVVPLSVAAGFAAVVELGPDEHIENVVVGNGDEWQVTANRAGDRIIVKPLSGAGTTNMVILTDMRRYVFQLDADRGAGAGAYVMRFRYPGSAVAPPVSTVTAAAYRLRGSETLFPVAMSDDGRRTTITWGKDTALPAIFAIENGREALVNGRMVDGDYLIEGVASRYVLRRGKERATARRQVLGAPRR